jgi:lysophospholipase L1-like esterase
MRNLFPVLLILLVGCAPVVAALTPTAVPGETEMPVFRYLALGDSYTIGESVAESERWPDQLAKQLAAERLNIDVTTIARTGWTVNELWQGIQVDPPEGTYDLVTLMIGVNDQYRGYPAAGYRDDFRFLLNIAIEYAGGNPDHVIVLSIPDWGVTPFAYGRNTQTIAEEIDQFNSINREESEKAGVHYADITPISRQVTATSDLIADDGLHPSGKMYSKWVNLVLPIARDILK